MEGFSEEVILSWSSEEAATSRCDGGAFQKEPQANTETLRRELTGQSREAEKVRGGWSKGLRIPGYVIRHPTPEGKCKLETCWQSVVRSVFMGPHVYSVDGLTPQRFSSLPECLAGCPLEGKWENWIVSARSPVRWVILGKSLFSGLIWFLFCLVRGANLNAREQVGMQRSGVDQLQGTRESWGWWWPAKSMLYERTANLDFSNVADEKEKKVWLGASLHSSFRNLSIARKGPGPIN